jgi:hypothetical protein
MAATPATIIDVYKTIPHRPFFIGREKQRIANRLRYAFRWLGTDQIFIKPTNSLYGIGAFGLLKSSELGSRRFWQAVDHIFNAMVAWDDGNDQAGNARITPPNYWGFQLQEGLNPVKVEFRGELHSHKIRALAALQPDGNYRFAGALACLGRGDIVGGFNAEPVSLKDFSMMIGLPKGNGWLKRNVARLTTQAAKALSDFAQANPYAISAIGQEGPFLGTNDFYGYQMDWIGFDLVVEREEQRGNFRLRFIEANDWRSEGARDLLVELGGENILSALAPIALHKAEAHFEWRTGRLPQTEG